MLNCPESILSLYKNVKTGLVQAWNYHGKPNGKKTCRKKRNKSYVLIISWGNSHAKIHHEIISWHGHSYRFSCLRSITVEPKCWLIAICEGNKMNFFTKTTFLFFVAYLAGCASSTVIDKPINKTGLPAAGNARYFVTDVHSQVPDVPEQFPVAIKAYLKSELTKRGSLAKEQSSNSRDVEITITDYRMRDSVNRVLWGVLAGKDGVESTVQVRDHGTNSIIGESRISSYNVTTIGGPDDVAKMHAEEIAKFLLGEDSSH